MKMKYLKRFLSVLLTGLISLNAVSLAAFAEETNDSSHFTDRKSTRLNSSHNNQYRMPSSA